MNDRIKTEQMIKFIRDTFTDLLFEKRLNLLRTSAPLIIECDNGVNDDLAGQSSAVSFPIIKHGLNAEIVQSLAKWKRLKLKTLEMAPGDGIYTNMNAIRSNEKLDKLHSAYVDQWDWEMVIDKIDRNPLFLFDIVNAIYYSLRETEKLFCEKFGMTPFLKSHLSFVSYDALKRRYPGKSQKEIEYLETQSQKSVFIYGLDKDCDRASDYDDWTLNGDLIIWSDTINEPIEISSMGIRVDRNALELQLEECDENWKKKFDYHKMILNGDLPQTIGGGIGQSRLCMLLMQRKHIGEVQSSVWDCDNVQYAIANNLTFL